MDQANTKKVSFYRKYKPLVVMIPAIIAIHYGWFLLQKDERIVPKSEQLTELPVITVSKMIKCLELRNLFHLNSFFIIRIGNSESF